MTDVLRELDRLQRQEKLRLWRNALLMAGILLCAIAGTAVVSGAGFPMLTWLAVPLVALGGVLLLIGLILTLRLAQG